MSTVDILEDFLDFLDLRLARVRILYAKKKIVKIWIKHPQFIKLVEYCIKLSDSIFMEIMKAVGYTFQYVSPAVFADRIEKKDARMVNTLLKYGFPLYRITPESFLIGLHDVGLHDIGSMMPNILLTWCDIYWNLFRTHERNTIDIGHASDQETLIKSRYISAVEASEYEMRNSDKGLQETSSRKPKRCDVSRAKFHQYVSNNNYIQVRLLLLNGFTVADVFAYRADDVNIMIEDPQMLELFNSFGYATICAARSLNVPGACSEVFDCLDLMMEITSFF